MNHEHSFLLCNTKDAHAVCAKVTEVFTPQYGSVVKPEAGNLFRETLRLFTGQSEKFQAVDTAYHDLEHTLQVVLCWTHMAARFNLHDASGPLSEDSLLEGLAAALLHDSGYLKPSGDDEGTGAKFTPIHEKRSCERSEEILSALQWPEPRRTAVAHMISTTGPRAKMDTIPFQSEEKRTVARMLATADFLAQMSDPGYPEKLPALFAEFEEAHESHGNSSDNRMFSSLDALASQTASFWRDFVLPRFEDEYDGVYRYLATPYPNGDNAYIKQAELNVDRISEGKIPVQSIYRRKN